MKENYQSDWLSLKCGLLCCISGHYNQRDNSNPLSVTKNLSEAQ
jgi:hypothetical protein